MESKVIGIIINTRKETKTYKLENKLNEPIDKFVRRNLLTILDNNNYYVIQKGLEYHDYEYIPCYYITEYHGSRIFD